MQIDNNTTNVKQCNLCTGVHKLEHLKVKVITQKKQHFCNVHTKQTICIKFDLLRMLPSCFLNLSLLQCSVVLWITEL